MWDDTPIDLFFDYAPIHSVAARNHRIVPFTGAVIPVLGPVELAAFKVVFDRTRDWADIEDMLRTGSLDTASLRGLLDGMLDAERPPPHAAGERRVTGADRGVTPATAAQWRRTVR